MTEPDTHCTELPGGSSLLVPAGSLEAVVRACPLPLISVDRDGQVTSWNPAAERLFGWQEGEVLGQPLPVIPPQHREDARRIRIETEEGRNYHDVEVVRHRRDGLPVMLSLSTAPLHDEEGQLAGTMLAYVDLSERKAAEEAIHAREQQLKTLIDQAPVGICVTTTDGVFEQVNAAWADMLGYEPHDLVGKHFSIVTPLDQLTATEARRRRDVEAGTRSFLEAQMVRKDGRHVTILVTTIPLTAVDGIQRRVSFGVDITERKAGEQQMEHRAHHDPLTGLANRLLLQDRLDQALAQARRQSTLVSVLFVDLDDFKAVNDHSGHDAGDTLLKQVATCLLESVRSSDTVARLAGDEFVVLLPDMSSATDAVAVAQKVLESLKGLTGGAGGVSASIGISLSSSDTEHGDDLVERADIAMYRAKARGKNTYALYSEARTS